MSQLSVFCLPAYMAYGMWHMSGTFRLHIRMLPLPSALVGTSTKDSWINMVAI